MTTSKFLVLLSLVAASFFAGGYFPAKTVKTELINQGVDQEQKKGTTNQCIERLRGKVKLLQKGEMGISPASFDETALPEIEGVDEYETENVSFFELKEFFKMLIP